MESALDTGDLQSSQPRNLLGVFARRNSCRELGGHDDDHDAQQYDADDDEQLEALEAFDVSLQSVFCVLEL